MILVTVGTSSFDPLIKEVDGLVGTGQVGTEVIAQIGEGTYIPEHMRYFRFAKNFDELVWKARLVITTGGAGTIFDCLDKRKIIIAVENTRVSNRHQRELLYKMHKEKYLFWCRDLDQLLKFINFCLTQCSGPIRIFEPAEKLDLNRVLWELVAQDEEPPWWKFWRR